TVQVETAADLLELDAEPHPASDPHLRIGHEINAGGTQVASLSGTSVLQLHANPRVNPFGFAWLSAHLPVPIVVVDSPRPSGAADVEWRGAISRAMSGAPHFWIAQPH